MAATSTASSKNPQSSCSPSLCRPTNPNSRNSETINPIRRSFSGNPFVKPSIIASQKGGGFNPNTPANSPSDYPRRTSIGRENIVVSLHEEEDKENSKDQNWKQAKVRSPASAKGTKNFMSPTISATSKINASPRKKILSERNEPMRTSVSSSDGKNLLVDDLDSNCEKVLSQKKEVSFDPTITYLGGKEGFKHEEVLGSEVNLSAKEDSDSLIDSVSVENDFVNLDPSFKISPRASCSVPSPALAPLDADPSMPPYDPKTNYLSPRPQFLHYKPNPRVELYLSKNKDGKRLEETFSSESFSDTEGTEEETQSEDSQKESEDAASSDAVTDQQEENEELLVSEPNPSAEVVEENMVSRRHFFTKTKFTVLLLALVVACLWATVAKSPVMDPHVLNNLSFPELYIPPEISQFARSNVEGMAQKFRVWLYHFLSHIHNVIIGFIERRKPGPLLYANLTTLLEDIHNVDSHPVFDHSTLPLTVGYYQNVIGTATIDVKLDTKSLEEEEEHEEDQPIIEEFAEENSIDQEFEGTEEIVADDNFEFIVQHSTPELEEVNMIQQTKVCEPDNSALEVTSEIVEITAELQNETDCKDQAVLVTQAAEVQPEVSVNEQPQAENDVISPKLVQPGVLAGEQPQGENDAISAKTESNEAEMNPKSLDSISAMEDPLSSVTSVPMGLTIDGTKNLFSAVGISLLVLSLLAGTVFTFVRKGAPTTPKITHTVEQAPATKKPDYCPISVATRHTFQERAEVDVVGESCPSEMSSFQYSSSYYSKKTEKCTSEVESHEKKPKRNYRRESLASSDYSMGSPSYGSFTTYERIPNKLGSGDDEVITPVRRSSRLRNQVTSP